MSLQGQGERPYVRVCKDYWGSEQPIFKSSCNESKTKFFLQKSIPLDYTITFICYSSELPLIQFETIPDQARVQTQTCLGRVLLCDLEQDNLSAKVCASAF